MSQETATVQAGPDRFLIGIVVGAIGLIALGFVAVFVAGRPAAPPPPDLGTPAGVVQAYVEAMRTGNHDQAQTYLTRAAQASIARDNSPEWRSRTATSPDLQQRYVIEPVREGPDSAEVRITISTFSANTDPFSTGSYHRDVTANLIREDGNWRISTPISPYNFNY